MAIEAAYWLAVLCGVVGAFTGSRSAWALLASAGLCWALDATGAAFETGLWLAIDLAVIAAILIWRNRASDWIVLALFLPIWALYLADEYTRYYAVTFLIMAQFFITLPWKSIAQRAVRCFPRSHSIDDIFNLKRGLVWWTPRV